MMPSSRSNDSAVDATPLLTPTAVADRRLFRIHRPSSLRGAASFLGRRRRLGVASVRVRDAAAQQIEERQSAWAYSRPIVVLDVLWNSAFVMLSVVVIVMSWKESPEVPLRMWIAGYVAQCCVHMVCVCVEFKRRRSLSFSEDRMRNSSSESEEGDAESFSENILPNHGDNDEDARSVAKHLESANTMFSFIWWIIGFYWISAGDETLVHDSPQLYWLCITFMAFDVFFVVICVAVACVIGIAVCCCLPCIIAILYAVADQEGATKDDIERLPKYKFRRMNTLEKQNGEIQESCSGTMTECNTNMPNEHILSMEDAECCICLSTYEDGTELRELPCRHHFHCACIDKWLYINATCPLCKFNILKNDNLSSSEEV